MCHVSIKPSAAAVESGRRACTIGDLFSRVQCCTVASVWDVYPFTLRGCEFVRPFLRFTTVKNGTFWCEF